MKSVGTGVIVGVAVRVGVGVNVGVVVGVGVRVRVAVWVGVSVNWVAAAKYVPVNCAMLGTVVLSTVIVTQPVSG